MQLRLPTGMRAEIEKLAHEDHRTISSFIRVAIVNEIRRRRGEQQRKAMKQVG